MEIWLPYPNFAVTALVLRTEELEQQCVDARSLQGILQMNRTWQGWKPEHVLACMMYGDCMVREWRRRGGTDHWPLMLSYDDHQEPRASLPGYTVPGWLGEEDGIHRHHRGLLSDIDRGHYEYWFSKGDKYAHLHPVAR